MHSSLQNLVGAAKQVFASSRPTAFVKNPEHCDECIEHNAVLSKHTVDSIGIDELGNPGWDPMCFISDEGFIYYFPALVRLCVEHPEYIDQFTFHISQSPKSHAFSDEQCQFVISFLEELYLQSEELGIDASDQNSISNTIQYWKRYPQNEHLTRR